MPRLSWPDSRLLPNLGWFVFAFSGKVVGMSIRYLLDYWVQVSIDYRSCLPVSATGCITCPKRCVGNFIRPHLKLCLGSWSAHSSLWFEQHSPKPRGVWKLFSTSIIVMFRVCYCAHLPAGHLPSTCQSRSVNWKDPTSSKVWDCPGKRLNLFGFVSGQGLTHRV